MHLTNHHRHRSLLRYIGLGIRFPDSDKSATPNLGTSICAIIWRRGCAIRLIVRRDILQARWVVCMSGIAPYPRTRIQPLQALGIRKRAKIVVLVSSPRLCRFFRDVPQSLYFSRNIVTCQCSISSAPRLLCASIERGWWIRRQVWVG